MQCSTTINVSHGLDLLEGGGVGGSAAGCRDILLIQNEADRVISSAAYLMDHCRHRPIFSADGSSSYSLYDKYILSSLCILRCNISEFTVRDERHPYIKKQEEM